MVKLLKHNFYFHDGHQVEPQSRGLCSGSPQKRHLNLRPLPTTATTGWLPPDFATCLSILIEHNLVCKVKDTTKEVIPFITCNEHMQKSCILALLNLFHDSLGGGSPEPALQCNRFTQSIARDVIRIWTDYARTASQDITQKQRKS